LVQAIADHKTNYAVHEEAALTQFRDDISPTDPFQTGLTSINDLPGTPRSSSGSIEMFSPHNFAGDIDASSAAVYSYSGWLDGGYGHGAIKRFLTLQGAGNRLILGPWNHGGGWDIADPKRKTKSDFDHDSELLAFFDGHLTQKDYEAPRVRYFTIGAGWKTSDTWPPVKTSIVPMYLDAEGSLSTVAPKSNDGADPYQADMTAASGKTSRWRTQLEIDQPVIYLDRAQEDRKLLVYTGSPLPNAMEVTGHPVIRLHVESSESDGNFVVFLEDVDEKGCVTYVTEGRLRAIHRKLASNGPLPQLNIPYRSFAREDAMPLVRGQVAELVFDLLPTSYVFRKGHAIRVAIACADADHFAGLPGPAPHINVHRSRTYPSSIDLPVA
jgi:uncharacterized protein